MGFLLAASLTLLLFVAQNRNLLINKLERDLSTKVYEIKGILDEPLDRALFHSEIEHHSRAIGVDHMFYRLLDASGKAVVTSDLHHWQAFPFDRIPRPTEGDLSQTWATLSSTETDVSARILSVQLKGGEILQAGLSMVDMERQQLRFTLVITGSMLLVSLLGSLFTWIIATRVLRGMKRVSGSVRFITSEGAFQERIALPTGSAETDFLAQTFNSVFKKIQELMESMEQVLGDIAHDMRTPVSRIRGFAESLISEKDATAREEEWAGHTIAEADRILSLVNTMLDINAAESIGLNMERAEVDLVPLVKEGLDLFQFMIEDKNLGIQSSLPEHAFVYGDKSQLQRVISNLLDNAIKYTEENGMITARVKNAKNAVVLEIEDTGIGVKPAETELIFKRFYRGDKSRTLPGNGLGLTFCRAMVQAMGGDIYLQEKESKGALFVVELKMVATK